MIWKSHRKLTIFAISACIYLVLWSLTSLIGAHQVLRSAIAAEEHRTGTKFSEPMGIRTFVPFFIMADKYISFGFKDLKTQESSVHLFRSTSLYFWIGTPMKLSDTFLETEVKALPQKKPTE